jgi:hypothetical protein
MMGADASFRLSQNNTLLSYFANADVPGSRPRHRLPPGDSSMQARSIRSSPST